MVAVLALLPDCLFALLEKFEVGLSRHAGGAHIGPDNLHVNFSIGGDHDGAKDTLLHVTSVISLLTLKDKSVFSKDAFQRLPVHGCYTRHCER